MDLETAQITTTAKLPTLKQAKTITNVDGTSTTLIPGPVTTKEKVQKKNDMKARRMDWLSKRKFVIVCHEKVVRIPLEGDEILQVHGERTQGVVKTLMNTKSCKMKVSYDLVIFRGEHQCRLLRRGAWSSFEVSVGITEEGEVSDVKDKILATPSETSNVENAPAEMLHDLDQQMEKRADDGCTLWIKLYSKYEYEIRTQ
ncbi:hypothetical protein Tco_0155545 [Tanacetum coccineum]